MNHIINQLLLPLPKIICIAAIADNHVIGLQNKLPWSIPEDLAFFKGITMGHTVVMGRNTWESIGKPLPGRKNIVLSKTLDNAISPEIIVCRSLNMLFKITATDPHLFIIGGENVYHQLLPFSDQLIITRINQYYQGDCFFPDIDSKLWSKIKNISGHSESFSASFSFEQYKKRD